MSETPEMPQRRWRRQLAKCMPTDPIVLRLRFSTGTTDARVPCSASRAAKLALTLKGRGWVKEAERIEWILGCLQGHLAWDAMSASVLRAIVPDVTDVPPEVLVRVKADPLFNDLLPYAEEVLA